MKLLKTLFLFLAIGVAPIQLFAWPGVPLPALHTEGRYLKDPCGNNVLLHGVAITPSPWFNGGASGVYRWNNYDVQGCLNYNNSVMDALTNTSNGWYLNYIRLHIDPYWSNNPGTTTTGEADISQFNYNRFVTYVNSVIIPLIDHARSRGMYVILRPPGVCPQNIALNDAYYKYLVTIWTYLSQHASLKNQANVMFELANEPVNIKASDGTYGQGAQKYYDALKNFMQPLVNIIRNNGANNVIWVPGLGWQSGYAGLANNPITGSNIGYAVHCYPGYWGAGLNNATDYQNAWNANVAPVANIAPIAITETDWGPSQYTAIFGKGGLTSGFGNKLKQLIDASGNVSWNVLCPEDLINNGDPNGATAFNNDAEACAKPVKSWFQAYSCCNLPASSCGGTTTGLVNNGVYVIEFKTDATKAIDLLNGTDADGTAIRPWTKNGATAQQWIAKDAGNGYWRFVSNASSSNRCIDLASGNTANGSKIQLWSNYGNDAQAWQVTDAGGGYYKIVSKLNTNRGFDVANCVVDGTLNLQLWDYYGTSCQLFKFNLITTKSAFVPDTDPSIDIYPNPAVDGNFTVVLSNVKGNSDLIVYSLDGKKVYEKSNLKEGVNDITSGLKKGLYMIKINSYTKKIVIE